MRQDVAFVPRADHYHHLVGEGFDDIAVYHVKGGGWNFGKVFKQVARAAVDVGKKVARAGGEQALDTLLKGGSPRDAAQAFKQGAREEVVSQAQQKLAGGGMKSHARKRRRPY